ncbi:MAG: DNA lyase [Nitrospira sp. SB0675_bin_23]|nr:DNA lyase [Nitrospira sp. SB0675_bin_23]
MRLWSIHPQYLDPRGLVALWREGLLAQAVLRGETTGYKHHPQLLRFRMQSSPIAYIAEYLRSVHEESIKRGYRFDARKIARSRTSKQIDVSRGQIDFEWQHLMKKLETRAPKWREKLMTVTPPIPHPLFRVKPSSIADWERF